MRCGTTRSSFDPLEWIHRRTMIQANPFWGTARDHGEILKMVQVAE
jgi:hypothetical protein